MGSDPRAAYPPDADEAPAHAVDVEPFLIGHTAVTNAQYARFVEATGHRPPGTWPRGCVPAGQEDVPVTYVSWHDAAAFCAWAGGRLPTEAEWEAAAGGDGRLWPWGDAPPTDAHAVWGRGIGGPEPAGARPAGASACGALDLAGNVGEWVASAYRPYPYDPADGREDPAFPGPRVVRGGSYIHDAGAVRVGARHPMLPDAIDTYVGFRVAASGGHGVRSVAAELVPVAGGRVTIGRDPVAPGGPALPDEAPQATIDLPAFAVTRTPVTNAQYASFVLATGHRPPLHWPAGRPLPEQATHPVTYVDHADAAAFSTWAGGRLPTEAEWEKAARGSDGRLHPWGDEPPDEWHAVFARATGGKGGATEAAGSCPAGASPHGLLDTAGNVWEWVSSAYRPFPYDAGDGREDTASGEERVLRGGSYASPARHVRCAARSHSYGTRLAPHIGFRVARSL